MTERRGPEGTIQPGQRELAAAAAIRAIDEQLSNGDPDWPTLTQAGALQFATAAIAAAQLVDIENGIERIRRSELSKLMGASK